MTESLPVIPTEPTRWRRFIQWYAGHRPCRLVYDGHTLLFARYYVGSLPRFLGGGQAYLHHYFRPDTRKEMHDHPWEWACSVILAGGYLEERLVQFDRRGPITWLQARVKLRKAGTAYILTGRDFHRIDQLLSASSWSLFMHGPYTKGWGFLDEDTMGRGIVFTPGPTSGKPDRGGWWKTAPRGRDFRLPVGR